MWTAPDLSIRTISLGGQNGDTVELRLTGSGFKQDVTSLFFVRAAIEADDGLQPYQIIPCTVVRVAEPEGQPQNITVSVLLSERDGGAYHLIAGNPPVGGVNQAAVFEHALALAKLPGQPVEVVVAK